MVRTKGISETLSSTQWRARARYTRELAQSACHPATIDRLHLLAATYDQTADDLDRAAVLQMREVASS